MDDQDQIRHEVERQTMRPPEFREYTEAERRAAHAEAMAQWLNNGTVKQEYLEMVLGDPVGSVSVPPRTAQDTVAGLVEEAREQGRREERERIVGVIEGCRPHKHVRFEVTESGYFVSTDTLQHLSPPESPKNLNPWLAIAKEQRNDAE